jgi:hypothetical protein
MSPLIDGTLKIHTEHKRNGQIFRGHPGFRTDKEMWNDWCIVDWGPGNGELPCEIWCFVDLTMLGDNNSVKIDDVVIQKGIYAVAECTQKPENTFMYDTNSDMFKPIYKDSHLDADNMFESRMFFLADVESIVDTACVVPDIGSDHINKCFLVTPRSEWSDLFQEWLVDAHNLDDMVE